LTEILVELLLPDGTVLENTKIPASYTVRQVVHGLLEILHLPFLKDGQRIEYSLFWVNQNMELDNDRTLADAGVATGDQLKLVPSAPVASGHGQMPEEPTGEAETIEVIVTFLDLLKPETETLALDREVQHIVAHLVEKYRLRLKDKLDRPVNGYQMRSKALQRFLEPRETLRQAGVPRHDRLEVHRREDAG
jgi:hypothetical protein